MDRNLTRTITDNDVLATLTRLMDEMQARGDMEYITLSASVRQQLTSKRHQRYADETFRRCLRDVAGTLRECSGDVWEITFKKACKIKRKTAPIKKDKKERIERIERKSKPISTSETPPEQDAPEQLRALYNEYAKKAGWAKWVAMTPERLEQVKARLKLASVEEHRGYLKGCWQNAHLRGENDRGWVADAEWFLTKKALRKFQDGAWNGGSARPSADDRPAYYREGPEIPTVIGVCAQCTVGVEGTKAQAEQWVAGKSTCSACTVKSPEYRERLPWRRDIRPVHGSG